MNRHALDVLQFGDALDQVARFAVSAPGAAAVRGLEPSDAPAWITDELGRVDETRRFLVRTGAALVPPIPDLKQAFRHIAVEGSSLEAIVLRDVAVLLSGAAATRRAIQAESAAFPGLARIGSRLQAPRGLEDAIRAAIDDAGEVKDNATRALARLRREIRGTRGRLVQKLEQFMAALPDRIQVADSSVSLRDGRYVIPVRREGRVEVGGLVHDESATGQTLFMEPPLAIEAMNRLRELEREEMREVQRILQQLTDSLRPHREALQETLSALIELDSLYARARYAAGIDGHCPDLVDGSGGFEVVNGRHPLLLATDAAVVPFDLRLDPEERVLLISGPNTGGKTVLLKAIGLLSALTQAGVIGPVGDGTRLPVFTDVFADIGDEQSIEASLSTFSAHLRNQREVLENAGAGTLVLMDEMGSGTDPVEGAALARSILLELVARGALTFATTHLGELKALAAESPAVVNASLQFDAAELRPTYRLAKGVPGRSYGLAIARRLGLPGTVLARAEAAMPKGERDLAVLLDEMEQKD
ncbi:MAG: endonuclease MutS2, partial [Gemmatimonadota bacterium]